MCDKRVLTDQEEWYRGNDIFVSFIQDERGVFVFKGGIGL